MGNDYSRMQGSQFPPGYFCIGFRQPDILQILHAGVEIIGLVKQVVQLKWPSGIRTEKRYALGIELRLSHEPFSGDCNNLERVVSCHRFICTLLEELLNHGYLLMTRGHFIKSIERNLWIFYNPYYEGPGKSKRPSNGDAREVGGARIGTSSIAAIALEDWSKILLVNSSIDIFNLIQHEVEDLWSLGISKANFCGDYGSLELGGQPWDSYKPESEKTPLLCQKLIEIMASKGFQLVLSTHVRGIIDTLFFQSGHQMAIPKFMMMSLNHQDQLRFYHAPSSVVNGVFKLVKEHWEKGILGDEVSGPLWNLRLKGSPWWVPDWDKDTAMGARLLISLILSELRGQGWKVLNTIELYRSQYDKSLFLMVPDESPSSLPHFCMSSHDVDRLCIAGAPENIQTVLKDEISVHWNKGVKEDSSTPNYLEFSLEGNPWLWDAEKCIVNLEGVGLICWVFDILDRNNWELVGKGADISSHTKYLPHTWIFSLKSSEQSIRIVG